MKRTYGMIGVIVAGLWVLPIVQAQDKTAAVLSATTGTMQAAQSPQGNLASVLGMTCGAVTNNGFITITSEGGYEYDFHDPHANVAAYDNNVKVAESRFAMTCDRVLIFFVEKQQPSHIIAIGNVDIVVFPDWRGTCTRADYDFVKGEIVMKGTPVRWIQGANSNVCTNLTYFLHERRVVATGNTRTGISIEAWKTLNKRNRNP